MIEERAFWLAWSQITGIGAVLICRLSQHFDSLAIAWDAKPSELEAVDGLGLQTIETITRERQKLNPQELFEQHAQANPHFWTPIDPDYPRLLLEIPDPPPLLYFQGVIELLENQGEIPAIAIVGTRAPSDYGRRWARKLSAALAQSGFTVVSGLAEGIDTETHQSCLMAGGRTIAVLGTGVDVTYPWFNHNLAQQITHQGLLLSEHPAGTQPDRSNFPRRNRIIAGLCRATLIIEAPARSGALITARLANEYGRDVYVLPGTLDNPCAKGCLELLNQGAHVILGEKELLNLLGTLPKLYPAPLSQTQTYPSSAPPMQLTLLQEETPSSPTLEPDLQCVFQSVTLEPSNLDQIVQNTGLTTAKVLSGLSQLELMGLISQLPGMRYQRG